MCDDNSTLIFEIIVLRGFFTGYFTLVKYPVEEKTRNKKL